jgi:hypothetical protein
MKERELSIENDIGEISLELEFKIVIDACVAVGGAAPGGKDIAMNQMKFVLALCENLTIFVLCFCSYRYPLDPSIQARTDEARARNMQGAIARHLFQIFIDVSTMGCSFRPMGAHRKKQKPSPSHGFVFKKKQPMGWAGLGWAHPIRSPGSYR